MPNDEIWIVGGTGRVGRAVARRLTDRNEPTVLLGRDAGRLKSAAADLGTRSVQTSDVDDACAAIRRDRPAVVVNTVGPFAETAGRVADACLDAGSHYLDLANDVGATLEILDRDPAARAAKVTLVTGAGFGVTAVESVALRIRGDRAAPSRLRVDAIPSVELREGALGDALAGTIVEGLPGVPGGGRFAGRRWEGELVAARIGSHPIALTTPDGDEVRTALMPLGDLLAAQRATGAAEVLAASSEVPTSGLARLIAPAALSLLSVPALRRLARRRLATVRVGARPRPRQRSWARAWAEWADGAVREQWVGLPEGEAFTSAVAAEVARRLRIGETRPGASTPAALFGSELAEVCGAEFTDPMDDGGPVGQ